MLKYLLIQLDDCSTSFCHYPDYRGSTNLMPLSTLNEAIFWSMKENLTLQFLYPDYELPQAYKDVIAPTFHADIVSSLCEDNGLRAAADVVVFDTLASINYYPFDMGQAYVIRTTLHQLMEQEGMIYAILPRVSRLSIVYTDIDTFSKDDEQDYGLFLDRLSNRIVDEYGKGHAVQVNILTDRILLDGMNNCNAGYETVTLAPDGKFYVCPALYLEREDGYSIGDLSNGPDIKNPQLYRLDHAPICRTCDAFQCKRCVWLNRKLTLEVNTPSREQCVMSHIERNASLRLLSRLRQYIPTLNSTDIPEIDYLDPFDNLIKND
ncbi:MAG: CXXX repeat peptide maturase [Muribaculaceae bacterium]